MDIHKRKGIIPRAVETIFSEIEKQKIEQTSPRKEISFSVECSFIQLYNEQVEDLLSNKKKSLNIRENPQMGVYVEGVKRVRVSCKEDLFHLIGKGFQRRVTASTALNDVSSRSHAIFRIVVDQLIKYKNQKGDTGAHFAKVTPSENREKKWPFGPGRFGRIRASPDFQSKGSPIGRMQTHQSVLIGLIQSDREFG